MIFYNVKVERCEEILSKRCRRFKILKFLDDYQQMLHIFGRHDTQHNDTQHNDTQYTDTQ